MQMYVDDGSIFACGSTYHATARKAEEGFKAITEWLYRNGLGAEPDKTEFMIFAPRRPLWFIGEPFTKLALRDPVHGEYHIAPSPVV